MKKYYRFSYTIEDSCIVIFESEKVRNEIAYINEDSEVKFPRDLPLELEKEVFKFIIENKLL